jgi:hypothetical protein
MNRIWKKFFKTVFETVALGLMWIVGCGAIFGVISSTLYFVVGVRNTDIIMSLSFALPLFLGCIVFVLRQVYTESKREVEEENRKLMRDIN